MTSLSKYSLNPRHPKRYFASFFVERALKKANGGDHSPREVLGIGLQAIGSFILCYKFATRHSPAAF